MTCHFCGTRRPMRFLVVVLSLRAIAADESCDAPPSLPLSKFAHAVNEDFIAKVTSGKAREFRPVTQPAAFDANGKLQPVDVASERFFTYDTDNGWNNQLLNLLAALDMARLINRTLIVPPFSWPRRRGESSVSVGRLVDLRRLARFGVRVLCEDEYYSIASALKRLDVP